jgi:hypothetical protein
MEKIILKTETRDYSFHGRVLSEREFYVTMAGKGRLTIYQTVAGHRGYKDEPHHLIVTNWADPARDVVECFGVQEVEAFFTTVLQAAEDPRRPVAYLILREAAANDPDLIDAFDGLAAFVRGRKIRHDPRPEAEGGGYFADKDPIYADTDALAVPQI